MIISSLSFKGGVGKTTLTQSLAVSFAQKDLKVCIVDCDETKASLKWSGVRFDNDQLTPVQCVSITDPRALVGNIKQLYQSNDIILLDGPPSLFPIVTKAMQVSHLILIPVTPTGGSDMWVTEDLLNRYHDVQEQKDDQLPAYFVINRYDPRINLHTSYIEVLETFAADFGVGILDAKLHQRTAFGEANAFGMGVTELGKSKAAAEVEALTAEIIQKSSNH